MSLGRLLRDQRGAAAVEFAIVLPVFFALLIGLVEFATYYWARSTLQFATEEAARVAILKTDATRAEIKAVVLAKLDSVASLDPARLTVDAVVDPYGGINFMRVTAQYAWPATGITGLFPYDLGPALGQARMPMVQ